MCGIVGFVSSKPNEELINKLVHSIIHRGPDESITKYLVLEINTYT